MSALSILDDTEFRSSTPQVRGDAQIRHYGNDAVAWSPLSPNPVHLDPVTSIVYQLLDGNVSIAELVTDVHEAIGVPEAIAKNRLRSAIATLDNAVLLASSDEPDSRTIDDELDLFVAPPNP
jgi:hypothetical protein